MWALYNAAVGAGRAGDAVGGGVWDEFGVLLVCVWAGRGGEYAGQEGGGAADGDDGQLDCGDFVRCRAEFVGCEGVVGFYS